LGCEKFTEIQYKIREVMFIVMESPHSPTFEQEKVFPPGKAALLPLKPLEHDFLQCLFHWHCGVLEGFYFQKAEQVKI
jgi:hypothetical protein